MHSSVCKLLLVFAAGVSAAIGQRAAIERAVRAAESLGVRTGVAVCDHDGRVLYRHRAAEAFAPASNMKLLTAIAALHVLGDAHTFRTVFRLQAGELVVVAGGDPNMIRGSAHAPERVFDAVAAALRRRSVTAVRAVRILPGRFTGPGRPATWPKNQLHTYYCAPTGACVLEQGTFVVRITPQSARTARCALVAPPAGYPLVGSIAMSDRSKGATYGAIDQGGQIKVRGRFYRGSPKVEIRTAVQDPERWFCDTLAAVLQRRGVRVDANAAAGPDGVVYEHRSPLAPALRRMLEDSSNFDAEQVLRVVGAVGEDDGSLAGGLAALRRALTDLCGTLPTGVQFADGSGLSRPNRVTPGLLVVAMFKAMARPTGARLRQSLPVAGRTGTLEQRFVDSALRGRVRAKTGWIRGASALSGLVEGDAGQPRWFSILMNYDPGRSGLNKELKRIQERIVAAVAAAEAAR